MGVEERVVDKIDRIVRRTDKLNLGLKLDYLRILANDHEERLFETVKFIAMKTKTPYEVQLNNSCLYDEIFEGETTYEGLLSFVELEEFRFFAKRIA